MRAPTIRESLAEYGRGAVGGLLFALPLLYTMEVWITGLVASPVRLLAGLGGTFGLLLLYNRFSGMREDATFWEVVVDSVEELALGLLISTGLLGLMGQLTQGDEGLALVGKIGVCGMMSAIGVSVGTAQLGEENPQDERETGLLGQLAIAMCGAVIVAGNVAPTEEIQRIGFAVSPLALLGLLAVCLALAAIITQAGQFRGSRPFSDDTPIPTALFSSVVTVAVGLVASLSSLAFFEGLGGDAPGILVGQVVVLAVPASLGASAGRLLLQA